MPEPANLPPYPYFPGVGAHATEAGPPPPFCVQDRAEIKPGWVALARANIALARRQDGTGTARIVTADATRLPRGIPTALRSRFQLVPTSPPYGQTMHGRVEHRRGPLVRFHNSYTTPGTHLGSSPGEANLAHRRRTGLVDGITEVLAGCLPLLAPAASSPLCRGHGDVAGSWSTCPDKSSGPA